MPISKENMRRYPGGSIRSKEWLAIRQDILDRAGHRCEGSPAYPDCRAWNHEDHPDTGSKVVLTIAHLDHKPENSDRENLKAWCQRCHNTYDQPHRQANRKRRAERKAREETGVIDWIDQLEAVQ